MTEEEQMLTAVLGCRRIDLYADRPGLSPEQARRMAVMRARRARGEPLQYILGDCNFMGRRFAVDPRVLIPRPETEILVETTVNALQKRDLLAAPLRILDVGTGSGNIAVTLAGLCRQASVTALDVSSGALEVARDNAVRHGVSGRIAFVAEDLTRFAAAREGVPFDVVIANPPYIARCDLAALPDEVRREPVEALDGGEDGLRFYRTIFAALDRLMPQGGLLALEIGDGQRPGLDSLWRALRSEPMSFLNDYRQTPRVALAWCHAHPGGER